MKALISVSDKTGIVELGKQFQELGIEIISTGGTSAALNQAEIPTTEVSTFTGSGEILGGRVKTLHPKIFGGILALRKDAEHQLQIKKHSLELIDWVVVNLYPFEKIVSENKIPKSEMIEFIDIGGVSLLRAAGKNFQDVVVLCDPSDYAPVLEEFKNNKTVSAHTRKKLTAKVFAHSAHCDSMIANFFTRTESIISNAEKPIKETESEIFPMELTLISLIKIKPWILSKINPMLSVLLNLIYKTLKWLNLE